MIEGSHFHAFSFVDMGEFEQLTPHMVVEYGKSTPMNENQNLSNSLIVVAVDRDLINVLNIWYGYEKTDFASCTFLNILSK